MVEVEVDRAGRLIRGERSVREADCAAPPALFTGGDDAESTPASSSRCNRFCRSLTQVSSRRPARAPPRARKRGRPSAPACSLAQAQVVIDQAQVDPALRSRLVEVAVDGSRAAEGVPVGGRIGGGAQVYAGRRKAGERPARTRARRSRVHESPPASATLVGRRRPPNPSANRVVHRRPGRNTTTSGCPEKPTAIRQVAAVDVADQRGAGARRRGHEHRDLRGRRGHLAAREADLRTGRRR